MLSPYGMEIVESCLTCKLRSERIFCDLPPTALQTLEDIKFSTAYPSGAVLFVEGQRHISDDYAATCREIRDLILSDSASEKLARLLVGWLDQNAQAKNPSQMKLALTHEEIGQMIGTSRETVIRLFAGFKKQRLIQQNGSTIVVPNRIALESLIPA
jgi:hypothetical protein